MQQAEDICEGKSQQKTSGCWPGGGSCEDPKLMSIPMGTVD